MKFFLDFAPLLAFFLVQKLYGLMPATGVLVVLTLVTVPLLWRMERKFPVMPTVTALLVAVFGGMTVYFEDEIFIKLKPTIACLLIGGVLLGGLALGKSLLKPMMQMALSLSDAGWRVLTRNYGVFFLVLAGCNEVARRMLTTDDWVTFKVFGILGLTLLFSFWQMQQINRRYADVA